MNLAAVQALGAVAADPILARAMAPLAPASPPTIARAPQTSFGRMLADGVDAVNQKLLAADDMATAFALDDSVPLHQVTYALEEARLSFELAMQVRARLVEAYQDLSKMQL
jgi:flagellar hook-basal body complex protein FliE